MATVLDAQDESRIRRLVTKDFHQAVTLYAMGYKVTRVHSQGSDQEITLADVKASDVLAYANDELSLSPRLVLDAYRTMKGVLQDARASQGGGATRVGARPPERPSDTTSA